MGVVVPWAASNPGYHALGSILTKLSTIVSLQHHFKDNINSLQNKFHNTLVSLQHHFNCRKTPLYRLSLAILLSNCLSFLQTFYNNPGSLQHHFNCRKKTPQIITHNTPLKIPLKFNETFYNIPLTIISSVSITGGKINARPSRFTPFS